MAGFDTKSPKDASPSVSGDVAQSKGDRSGVAQFVDNRPQASAHRTLQAMVDASPRARRAGQLKSMLDNRPAQRKKNQTGLPDQLKAGIESLGGMSLDHVKVHYNSPHPARLNAHAYAQGGDIHIAPGQAQHLPHEAWHVVQQAQGRVAPTRQLNGNVPINDDHGLEREADIMGARALQRRGASDAPSSARAATSARIMQALAPKALEKPVLQAVFTGFPGGGWALNNDALPALNAFPGGGNNNGGGQQAGATARAIDISTTSPYVGPNNLGGFTHFSNRFGNGILTAPVGANRHTHLHVINGKLHGPPTADNLVLGSALDNTRHRVDVEDHIRNGLPGADTAAVYNAQIAANPPFAVIGTVAYWNNPALAMVGAAAAAKAATIMHKGAPQPYTHSADPAKLGTQTRWAHYSVAPAYGGQLSPTIFKNIAARYTAMHGIENNALNVKGVPLLPAANQAAAALAVVNASAAMNKAVTAATLAGGVPATLAAGNVAADGHLQPAFKAGAAAASYANYTAAMAALLADMTNFDAWAQQAFPTSLVCDAHLYQASYDPANIWNKRTEAQTPIPTNQV